MKKILCMLLCLMLLLGTALAEEAARIGDLMEVVNCEKFVTLREEPSVDAAALDWVPLGEQVRYLSKYNSSFAHVLYGDQEGYVLSEYIAPMQETQAAYAPVEVEEGSDEFSNVNQFLSSFVEQYFLSPCGYLNAETASDQELVQFAIEHIWFNDKDCLEWGEWQDGISNVRLSAEYIPAVCEEYFGRAPELMEALYADYIDGYFYWTETGGHTSGGIALMEEIERVGADEYRVMFSVYGQIRGGKGNVHALSKDKIIRMYPEAVSKNAPSGCAVFTAADLADRSSWKLEWICMDWTD